MLGVYTPDGVLVAHFARAGDASRMALDLGEGARVTSADGGYVVRDGALRLATSWQTVPVDYVAGWMADAYGGSLN